MPLTHEQIAKIRKKESATPDALKRNPYNDYTEGWFHVTLNTRGEAPVLGYVTGDPDAEDGSANAPRCVLTELGRKVEEEWRGIGRYYPLCVCEEIQVMPEHLHALLHLLPGNRGHLGRIVNGLMIGCTHAYWDTLGIAWREMRAQIDDALKRYVADTNADAAARKAQSKVFCAQWQDRDHTRSYRGPALMVRGYNDVEAVTAEEIEIKRQYIRNNPRKRLITRSKPDRFRVMRNQRSRNWTLSRALAAVAADPWIGRNPHKCQMLQANVNQRLKRLPDNQHLKRLPDNQPPKRLSDNQRLTAHQQAYPHPQSASYPQFTSHPQSATHPSYSQLATDDVLALDYVGNRGLLAAEKKVSLICHRADVDLFEQQKAAVMKAAREGAVVVSAFISPKERDIMKQLMLEQLPFIELMDNGFSDRYKPIGKAFYSVAENRHVQMTCWTYRYRNENETLRNENETLRNENETTGNGNTQSTISREMCLVMNELARIISGVGDDWWKQSFTTPPTQPLLH